MRRLEFLRASLAPNTLRTYGAGLRQYLNFCSVIQVTPFPLAAPTLELFVTSLARRVAYKSIRVYLSGLQYFSTIRGWPHHVSSMATLHYILRGIRRVQGPSFTRPVRAPFLVSHLLSVFRRGPALFSPRDVSMIRAAFALAFYGLLRVSEFTSPHVASWDPEIHLSRADVVILPPFTSLSLRIKASKTDPFREGHTLRLVSLPHLTCPVAALRSYLRLPHPPSGPLFTLADGRFLTRAHVARFLLVCFRVPLLSTHSFRIGGASALANAGVPLHVVQQLGRWRSDAFLRYLRVSSSEIDGAFRALFRAEVEER